MYEYPYKTITYFLQNGKDRDIYGGKPHAYEIASILYYNPNIDFIYSVTKDRKTNEIVKIEIYKDRKWEIIDDSDRTYSQFADDSRGLRNWLLDRCKSWQLNR